MQVGSGRVRDAERDSVRRVGALQWIIRRGKCACPRPSRRPCHCPYPPCSSDQARRSRPAGCSTSDELTPTIPAPRRGRRLHVSRRGADFSFLPSVTRMIACSTGPVSMRGSTLIPMPSSHMAVRPSLTMRTIISRASVSSSPVGLEKRIDGVLDSGAQISLRVFLVDVQNHLENPGLPRPVG